MPALPYVSPLRSRFAVGSLVAGSSKVGSSSSSRSAVSAFSTSRAWSTSPKRSRAAQLNYAPGQTVANAAIVKMAVDGTISVYALAGPVDVLIDVHGYYTQPVPTTTYAYNGDGLRTSKTVSGATRAFTWDQAQGLPLMLTEGTAASSTKYIYGPGGLPLQQIDPAGNVIYFHHDQLGSTRLLTDTAGAAVGAFTYDAYGNRTGSTGTATTPFGFAGEYTDAETGFVYLRARYYDPATGQFMSRDPLVAMTGSAYAYVAGNPLNGTDPSGLCWGPGCWLESAAKSTHGQIVKQVANTSAALTGLAATGAAVLALTPCSAFCAAVAVGLGITSSSLDTLAAIIECTDGGGFDARCSANIAGTLLPVVSGLVLGQLNVDPLLDLIASHLDNAKDVLGLWFDRTTSEDC
jgi:RHS repeat-associated protein